MIEARACGKIYIAGEYAVVLNKPAIIAPIKKYLTIKITPSEEYYLQRNNHPKVSLVLENKHQDNIFIIETLNWFNQYLGENNLPIQKFIITISSELDDNNAKFGFGSSAAVTIALLKCLFRYYKIKYHEMMLYKAGVMIQLRISKHSSYGDLACIAFAKVILYQKFNHEVIALINNISINEALALDWQGLIIKPIKFDYPFLIVYTNSDANSFSLVSKVLAFKDDKAFNDFLSKSEVLVHRIINEPNNVKQIIFKLSNNLKHLNRLCNNILITKTMEEIENIIKTYNGIMKFSGAGGGDSVICFFDDFPSLLAAKITLTKAGYLNYIYPIKEKDNESQR